MLLVCVLLVCRKFENVYIGWGIKHSAMTFDPALPPLLMEEFPPGKPGLVSEDVGQCEMMWGAKSSFAFSLAITTPIQKCGCAIYITCPRTLKPVGYMFKHESKM